MKLYRIRRIQAGPGTPAPGATPDEILAEVVEFSSGVCAIGWLMDPGQVTIWSSYEHAVKSHAQDETIAFEPFEEESGRRRKAVR